MRQRKTLIISAIIGVLAVVGILAIYFAFQNEKPEEPPLEQVLEETIENNREALLKAARK